MTPLLDTTIARILVLWTVRLAVGCYLLRVLRDLRFGRGGQPVWSQQAARVVWTVGAVCLGIHVIAVFHYLHGWSHAAAYQHTAEETTRVTGIDIGGFGIYVNYLFLGIWTMDAAVWWFLGDDWPGRHRWYFCILHVVFAFIVLNATVVFGPPGWISAAAMFLVFAVIAILLRARRVSDRKLP
jgi:hypothetical protein